MSNPRAACGPVKSFVRPSLGFRCIESILHTDNLSFDNLEFDISNAGGPQCHSVKSVTIAVGIRTLSLH